MSFDVMILSIEEGLLFHLSLDFDQIYQMSSVDLNAFKAGDYGSKKVSIFQNIISSAKVISQSIHGFWYQ